MNTTNGTDWDKCGNAIIIYHTNGEAPLWLSDDQVCWSLREMLKELEGGK